MIIDAEIFRAQDEARKEIALARNNLDDICYSLSHAQVQGEDLVKAKKAATRGHKFLENNPKASLE